VGYAELMAWSNFSWLRGASHPEELVARAHALGYSALAITDDGSVAGVVRAHQEARRLGLRLLPGASFRLTGVAGPDATSPPDAATAGTDADGWRMVVLPRCLNGWGNLCQYITACQHNQPKGQYQAVLPSAGSAALEGCEIILLPPRSAPQSGTTDTKKTEAAIAYLTSAKGIFCLKNNCLWLGAVLHQAMDDGWWLMQLHHWAALAELPLVAVGAATMHTRSRKPLHDVLTAIRRCEPVAQCSGHLMPNGQAHLRTRLQLARLYPSALLHATTTLAQRCQFELSELRYRYPTETVAPGETPAQTLARLTWAGAQQRYGHLGADACVPDTVARQLAHELALITELRYEMYFLTVHDLVRFARERDILCQGRGSAANSAVCYCLGITEVDPASSTLLFERFISRERNEPPDIDVDFEHQRREEVIQYIYAKYGRDRAALTATVTSYRPRSALRDVGKALQVPPELVHRLAKEHPGMVSRTLLPERLADALARLSPETPVPDARTLDLWLTLAQRLVGFPRHLGQHVGGFVLTDGPLTRLVPVEPAAMAGRSIIQWDKDDLDAMGLLKVDVLALGMLSALRRSLDLLATKPSAWATPGTQDTGRPPSNHSNHSTQPPDAASPASRPGQLDVRSPHARTTSGRLTLAAIPQGDAATYAMAAAADTVGVFQIESRAQMGMLPRLQPRCFYDLVIQVAIVRPGPIQGGMVHPYLRRRHGQEPVSYPSRALETALGRTLGVPIFQEQVMQVAMLCAGFSAGEADSLRRAMAAWKRKGGVQKFYDRVVSGMLARGYTAAFAEQIFSQIEGFGEYGFPESHAASFALLVYVSAWVKRHHPDVFLAALLNSQPMGFYGPSQLVQDARRHGVQVWPVDVLHSEWDCTLAPDTCPGPGLGPDTAATPPPLLPHLPHPNGPTASALHPVRLGLRLVAGLERAAAERLVQARTALARSGKSFSSVAHLAQQAALPAHALDALSAADALASLAGHRHAQVWAAAAATPQRQLFEHLLPPEDELPECLATPPALAQEVVGDYSATGLSLKAHPVGLLRPHLASLRLTPAAELAHYPSGRLARACGIVTVRQQPGTAKGVMFITLEDESGTVNVVVWKSVREAHRQEWAHARLLAVYGVWQRDDDTGGQVRHLIAKRLKDLTPLLGELGTRSRDFR
jgi:error-prone DNA polymerase